MRKRALLLGVAVMLAAFTACGSSENPDQKETQAAYEYETDIIRYGEAAGAFSFRKDVERTQTDCAVYYFETSISEQERRACIAATDRALSCIDGTLPEIEIAVFTSETLDGTAVSDNRLYTEVQPWDSAEYLTEVLLAAYSEWGNYGLAYGYANHLREEAGLDYKEADGFRPMSSPEPYDLNLLCFDEKFVLTEDAEAARNDACYFVNEYLSAHSEEEFLKLLSDSGTAEGVGRANEELGAFYAENGADCSLTEIRYRYGGVTYDYAAACEYAAFYIDRDWQDETWETNPMVSEHFLHEDYNEVRAFFECNERQMGQYQELFGFDSYHNELTIMFSNSARTSALEDSFYRGEDHIAYISSVVSLIHEYIHSVMFGHFDWGSLWKREGFARYYENRYNEYAYGFWDYDYNNQPENETGARIKKCIDWLGRPIDSKTDIWEIVNVAVCACGYTDPNSNYTTAESFIGYLIERYGEQATIAYVCSEDEYNAEWGKSYDELVQDWNEYIEEYYSWYDRS